MAQRVDPKDIGDVSTKPYQPRHISFPSRTFGKQFFLLFAPRDCTKNDPRRPEIPKNLWGGMPPDPPSGRASRAFHCGLPSRPTSKELAPALLHSLIRFPVMARRFEELDPLLKILHIQIYGIPSVSKIAVFKNIKHALNSGTHARKNHNTHVLKVQHVSLKHAQNVHAPNLKHTLNT